MVEHYGRLTVSTPGDPSSMEWIEGPLPSPADDEVSILQEAVGVDFIDTQIRSGQMAVPLPTGIGFSAVGRVVGLGKSVDHLLEGDRVAYSWSVAGSYAEARNVPAERVIRLPDQSLDPRIAAGALFRGLTAWYLADRLRRISPGDFVLVHAAAGGVGSILCQWLAHLGARVIGTTGSAEKLESLGRNGCEHTLLLDGGWAARVAEITGGQGCAVVYDSVGRDTFEQSLDCAARFGLVVSYGWVSGDPDPVPLATLRNKGSLFVTRPTISHYTADPADLQIGAAALFKLMAENAVRIRIGASYPLREAARAHADLVARRTSGSVILEV